MAGNFLIVVGVDGSDGGRRALDWAVEEAANRNGAVQAVIAWHWDGIEAGLGTATSPTVERERAAAVLDREIRELTARRGAALPVVGRVLEGRAADVLTVAARAADLLVLGGHGHGRLRRTVLGSVSEECVRKATCPVLIIPDSMPDPTLSRPAAEPALHR